MINTLIKQIKGIIMDKERLQELGGVVAEATEQEKALKEAAANKPEVLEEAKDETLEENMFGRQGYGGEKSQEGQVISELTQMLRDIKVFMRDGNMKDAAMMVDRAYSRVAGANRGE